MRKECSIAAIIGGGRACERDQGTEPVWQLCGRPLDSFTSPSELAWFVINEKADLYIGRSAKFFH